MAARRNGARKKMYYVLIYENNGKLFSGVYTREGSAEADLKRYKKKGVVIGCANPSFRNYGLIDDLLDHSDEL